MEGASPAKGLSHVSFRKRFLGDPVSKDKAVHHYEVSLCPSGSGHECHFCMSHQDVGSPQFSSFANASKALVARGQYTLV